MVNSAKYCCETVIQAERNLEKWSPTAVQPGLSRVPIPELHVLSLPIHSSVPSKLLSYSKLSCPFCDLPSLAQDQPQSRSFINFTDEWVDGWVGGWMDDEKELEAKKGSLASAWVSYYPSAFFSFLPQWPADPGNKTEPHPLPLLSLGPPSSL